MERIGPVAYHLALPPILSRIHDVFHVSILSKYIYHESHIIDWGSLQVDLDGHLALEPICMVLRTLALQGQELDQVRVQWDCYDKVTTSWEDTSQMRA